MGLFACKVGGSEGSQYVGYRCTKYLSGGRDILRYTCKKKGEIIVAGASAANGSSITSIVVSGESQVILDKAQGQQPINGACIVVAFLKNVGDTVTLTLRQDGNSISGTMFVLTPYGFSPNSATISTIASGVAIPAKAVELVWAHKAIKGMEVSSDDATVITDGVGSLNPQYANYEPFLAMASSGLSSTTVTATSTDIKARYQIVTA